MNLVNWPVPDPTFGLEDSGEGGLFAYLVVEFNDLTDISRESGGCFVDVQARLNFPDVVVTKSRVFPKSYVTSNGRQYPDSVALKFVAYLGATNFSLCQNGNYFEVRYDHLTQDGKRLYDVVSKVYGQPTILTFLDT